MQSAGTVPPHRVLLLRDRENPALYKARPGYLAVVPGDKVRFVNHTQGPVTITFQDGNVFGQPTVDVGPDPGARSADLTVVLTDPGRYRYAALANGVDLHLQGESSPEIIIDGQ